MTLEHYQTAFEPLLYGVGAGDRPHLLLKETGPRGAAAGPGDREQDVMNRQTPEPESTKQLLERCRSLEPVPTAVAHPCEATALAGAVEAGAEGADRADPGRPGREDRGDRQGRRHRPRQTRRSSTSPHSHAAAAKAVELVREGEAELLMKGSLHTDELLGAVVARETGLRTGRRISHVFIMDVPTYHKVLIVTDAAINIAPTLEDKVDICQNAIDLAHVARRRAAEGRDPRRGRNRHLEDAGDASTPPRCARWPSAGRSRAALLDGPLAFDNAISKEAAKIKGITSEVAGDPDILLAPDLEAGNILAKQLSFLANADSAGLVLGARVPIILTSRADSVRSRIASCAVADAGGARAAQPTAS